jgi:two-component system, response regulator
MPERTAEILLVEDSPDDAAFFVHALREGHPDAHCVVAQDGVEALALVFGDADPRDALPRIRPRLIVLDLKLPKVDGLEVLRCLKSNPHTRSLPTVVLSSSKENRDLAESYQLGVNSFLVKPMDFDEFARLVHLLASYWLDHNHTLKS